MTGSSSGSFSLTVVVPATDHINNNVTDPFLKKQMLERNELVSRSVVKAMLDQARQDVGDTRKTSGDLIVRDGSDVHVRGHWSFTPPA